MNTTFYVKFFEQGNKEIQFMGEGQRFQRQAHQSLFLFSHVRKEGESCVLAFETSGPCPQTRFLYSHIIMMIILSQILCASKSLQPPCFLRLDSCTAPVKQYIYQIWLNCLGMQWEKSIMWFLDRGPESIGLKAHSLPPLYVS